MHSRIYMMSESQYSNLMLDKLGEELYLDMFFVQEDKKDKVKFRMDRRF